MGLLDVTALGRGGQRKGMTLPLQKMYAHWSGSRTRGHLGSQLPVFYDARHHNISTAYL